MKMNCVELFNWSDPQIALITGASSGLGETYARTLANLGFNLILVARRKERMEILAEELSKAHKVDIQVVVADLTIDSEIHRVADLISKTKNLDILVNNAGFGSKGLFHENDFTRQLEMLKVHVEVPIILTRRALESMVPNNRGVIINMSSLGSFIPTRGAVMYVATKTFVRAFSESISQELKNTNIKIQALCPGFTKTEYHSVGELKDFDKSKIPKGMWMEPEKVVEISLTQIKKGKAVVIPGFINKFSNFLIKVPGIGKLIISGVNKKT